MLIKSQVKIKKLSKLTISSHDFFLILLGLLVTIETINLGLLIIINKPARWTHVLLPVTGAVFWSSTKSRLAERKEIENQNNLLLNLRSFNTCNRCSHFEGTVKEGELFVCKLHPYGQQNCSDYLVNDKLALNLVKIN